MPIFDRKDVDHTFSKTIVVRGTDYLRMRRVLDAWYNDKGDLFGTVQGTESKPYVVKISFQKVGRFVNLDTECSCPYGYQCKHAAALALHAIAHEVRKLQPGEDALVVDKAISLPQAPEVKVELALPPELVSWLHKVEIAAKSGTDWDPESNARVFYVLKVTTNASGVDIPTVTPVTRTVLKSGGWGSLIEFKNPAIKSRTYPKACTVFDCDVVNDLDANAQRMNYERAEFRLDGKHGSRLIETIIRSERCIWEGGPFLTLGKSKPGKIVWETGTKKTAIRARVTFAGSGKVLYTPHPWYVDIQALQCGPLSFDMEPELASTLVQSGDVAPEYVEAVRDYLKSLGLTGNYLPTPTKSLHVRAPLPVPCLDVDFEACERDKDYWTKQRISAPIAFAKLSFEYEGHKAVGDSADVRVFEGDEVVVFRRNPTAEAIAKDYLTKAGWEDPKYSGWVIPKGREASFCMVPSDTTRLLEPIERVAAFAKNNGPKLISAGWKIHVDQSYRFVPDSEIEWNIGVDGGSGIDWFEFQLGIKVEGKPYDLRPVLSTLFKELGEAGVPGASVARSRKSDDFFVFGPDGQVIRLSRQRLSAILQPLVEIFGGAVEWPDELKLPRSLLSEAGAFRETIEAAGVGWKSNDELARLSNRFAAFDHLEPLPEPEGFSGELRGYQKEGLAWLQFLREYDFGGVLADDMGLGKTVQVLAHIQAEKNAGRLDRPCLIVAPTSTIPNWRRECERFVPNLTVLTLQGAGRSGRFSDLKDVDIALTTYPLLARDKGLLSGVSYHIIVLDEAQNVKNPATAAAKAARELRGRHRICMSGTPVENHLGELWSLFQFLMPGFLGTDADFKRRFRGPIEKQADVGARDKLSRRIRPFMLRRTKGQVVKELPPKTEIIETIEFDEAQRDLYEAIRMSMDEQVRSLIAAQGFEKSRFQILDALLKLRQVCCDPRLVKLASARSVTESAKLDRLLEMLGVLLEDGRKILLFSQFTSMLNLIEERLKADGIQWVRISGDTIDRETPVQQFQAGEVPLFIISLKAGGTGLNLTAADTVILYDPWWNPAVENQAIDRAHRSGQDKAVIVYKLVASGTIEEKMLEMQARKGDIARSILTDDAEGIRTLTSEDLQWVLAKE